MRITPNELSFGTARSYQDIYGHTSRNKKPFLKTDFFQQENRFPGIVATQDPAQHAVQRRGLSNAFSTKALRDQETVINKYVDMFIDYLGRASAEGQPGVNTTEAYMWITFDIIGKHALFARTPWTAAN